MSEPLNPEQAPGQGFEILRGSWRAAMAGPRWPEDENAPDPGDDDEDDVSWDDDEDSPAPTPGDSDDGVGIGYSDRTSLELPGDLDPDRGKDRD